jgi:hypothetical protein
VSTGTLNGPELHSLSEDTVFSVLVHCLPTGIFAKSIVARAVATAYTNQGSPSYKVLKVLLRSFALPHAPHFPLSQKPWYYYISRVVPIGHILQE